MREHLRQIDFMNEEMLDNHQRCVSYLNLQAASNELIISQQSHQQNRWDSEIAAVEPGHFFPACESVARCSRSLHCAFYKRGDGRIVMERIRFIGYGDYHASSGVSDCILNGGRWAHGVAIMVSQGMVSVGVWVFLREIPPPSSGALVFFIILYPYAASGAVLDEAVVFFFLT